MSNSTTTEYARLSMERPYKDENGNPIQTLLDITPDGQHSYEPQKEPIDVLGENLRRIFRERGTNFFDKHPELDSVLISHDTIAKDETESSTSSNEEDEASTQPMTVEELQNMRTNILHQLFIAHGEISHARDLLSVFLAVNAPSQPGPSQPSLLPASASQLDIPGKLLPSSTLSATIITKPPPIRSVDAFDAQLAVGGKDESLRKAASLLKSAASGIERGRAENEQYWSDALKIRRANWVLTPAPLPFGAPTGRGADRNCTDFLISYGLEESLTTFRRRAIGRLPTTIPTEGGLVTFPYRQRSRLRISLGSTSPLSSTPSSFNTLRAEDTSTVDGELQAAQREIVEHEIFAQLIREAGNLPTATARVSEQLVVIEAAQGAELRFELIGDGDLDKLDSQGVERSDNAKCDLIYALLQVLLLRSHSRARSQRLSNTTIVRTTLTTSTPSPILQPIIDFLQYDAFCERARAEIGKMTNALSAAGIPAKVRFDAIGDTGEQLLQMMGSEGDIKLGGQVAFRIDGSHTIRFTLLSPSTLTAHLPQATLTVASITQLSQLLADEVEQCLLTMICDMGREICESVSSTWFVDSLAGRSLGKWEGATLDFRISFGADSRVSCSLARMLRGHNVSSSSHLYNPVDGASLLEWARQEINFALLAPTATRSSLT